MKTVLLADVHANVHALRACLADARARGCTGFAFLGDMVGYGGDPGADVGETDLHRHHLDRLRQWSRGLPLEGHNVSLHVLQSSDTAEALLCYARANAVSLIILGAATHGLKLQRLLATVPIHVAMHAPCSVMLVKPELPFERLGAGGEPAATMPHEPASV